jgi:hypothetical protein
MIENDTEDGANSYEQGQATSKYIERYTNPSLGGNSSRLNRDDSNGFCGDMEIKVEKVDSLVSFNLALSE